MYKHAGWFVEINGDKMTQWFARKADAEKFCADNQIVGWALKEMFIHERPPWMNASELVADAAA